MKVSVNFDLCASTGACTVTAPEVFELRDDGYLYILQDDPAESLRAEVTEAVDLCPTGAISIED